MTDETPELKTSDEWNKEYDKIVMDPDGWRSPTAKDWYEPISFDEFRERASRSTVMLFSQKSRELFNY